MRAGRVTRGDEQDRAMDRERDTERERERERQRERTRAKGEEDGGERHLEIDSQGALQLFQSMQSRQTFAGGNAHMALTFLLALQALCLAPLAAAHCNIANAVFVRKYLLLSE